ncbi:MAG: CoA-binding protein [Syntrophus sp. (in: bacteria)]|nr:CoA-binding protein [Syntrophus sp. (in: bacteria)]
MDLKRLFKPETMAVFGVSQNNDSHPANVIYNKNHLRYQVSAFAVNGKGGAINGETVYAKIQDIPKRIDLAVIATKAEIVPMVIAECIEAGVGGAVIISGGFAETGLIDLQNRVVSMAREADFPFIGPNCLGVYAPPLLDTFFIPSERIIRPEQGRVAMVSQSGGILVDHMLKCASEGVGLSLAVSIGNKALIRETDLLQYFRDDPGTDVITFYLEGFDENEGRRFVLAASECGKPVVVLKSGKTSSGANAVKSHTASMAGNYEVFSSVMAQYGVVEATDEYELVTFAESLSCYKKTIEGKMGIITSSGGHGALATDTCFFHGLQVPALSTETRTTLCDAVSPAIQKIASFTNPVDLTGSSTDDDFVAAARLLSKNDAVDCIMMLLLPYQPGITMDLGARISLVHQQEGKPIIAYVPHVDKYSMLIEGFMLNKIPVAHSVEDAVHMAEAMRRYKAC